jgi:HSP20 family protein
MAGNHGVFDVGQLGIDDVKVGPAYAACAHLDANLPIAGNGIHALLHLQKRARRRQYHRTHARFSNQPVARQEHFRFPVYQASQPSFDLNQGQSLQTWWGIGEPGRLGQIQLGGSTMTLKSLIPVGSERGVTRATSNPFSALQQEIDRLFEGFSRGFTGFAGFPSRELMPSMDLSETDKEIEISAELPGLEEKDIQLNVSDNVLTIRGEKKNEREETKKDYHLIERSYGSFTRSVQLPDGVNADNIKAVMSKGVLKVTVPKPAPAQTKKIDIKAAA